MKAGSNYANGGWNKEIPGFWIAKFEAGYVGDKGHADTAIDSSVKYTTITTWAGNAYQDATTYYYGTRAANTTAIKWPTFQPFRPSFNYIAISDAYELCKAIDGSDNNEQENPYKLSNVDSHLTKNSEWGAVAYLSYSDYGRGHTTEITVNNRYPDPGTRIVAVTGYAAENVSDAAKKFDLDDLTNGRVAGQWNSAQGVTASTTGNVSGIYDMVGGLWEWTAGYMSPTAEGSQTYGVKLIEENSGNSNKYKSKYEGTTVGNDPNNYANETNVKRRGEAIWETSTAGNSTHASWNGDFSSFMDYWSPYTLRGGERGNTGSAGVFAFNRSYGYCQDIIGFRPVLVCE